MILTARNLSSLLAPKSVALVGASTRPGSVGATIACNLLGAGLPGPVWFVNPKHAEIAGTRCFPDVPSLPDTPELAVICTPAPTVTRLIGDLGQRGTRAAIVITAGARTEGADFDSAVLAAAKRHDMRVLGPNCLGVIVTGAGLDASFAHTSALKGDLALVSQSGAIVTSVLDWAKARGIGFSHLVSLGNMVDVDVDDLLDHLATDAKVRAILLYLEGIRDARNFMSAARAAARVKPVIVLKAGRHPEGARAAASHTGAMAGSDAVYDAAFERAGLVRVADLGDLFEAAEVLSRIGRIPGERLAILTNGGGFGVLATDAWLDAGGILAALSAETMAALNAALPPTWSRANPVDIIGDADADRHEAALSALLRDPGIDTVLALNCPTGVASSAEAADGLLAAWSARPRFGAPNLLACWLTAKDGVAVRARFAAAGVPAFDSIEAAVAGGAQLAEFARNQRLMLRVPSPSADDGPADDGPSVDAPLARRLIETARRPWMDAVEAKRLIAAHGIPVVPVLSAATPEEAGRAAEELGGAVALKIRSSTVLHKSDVGGVVLDLSGRDAVRAAAESMLARIEGVEGFTVEAMARKPNAFELILGSSVDPTFGPVILFGHGGTGVSVIADTALALPPLDRDLAHALIARTRVAKLLRGYRDRPAVNLDAVADALVAVSRLVLDHPEIVELDINPILADAGGLVAVDVRVRLDDPASRVPSAIVPYPRALDTVVPLPDGTEMHLRPVRPDDATILRKFLEAVSPEDIRARFHGALRDFGALTVRLTQIDYDREIALVGFRAGDPLPLGVVRLHADPDGGSAEFAILVRSDLHGHGLGTTLMRRIIDVARERGLRRLVGSVLRDNARMLRLVRDLGFVAEEARGDEVTMALGL